MNNQSGNSKEKWEAQKDNLTLAFKNLLLTLKCQIQQQNKRLQQQATSPHIKNSERGNNFYSLSTLILFYLLFVFPGFGLQAVQGLPTA